MWCVEEVWGIRYNTVVNTLHHHPAQHQKGNIRTTLNTHTSSKHITHHPTQPNIAKHMGGTKHIRQQQPTQTHT